MKTKREKAVRNFLRAAFAIAILGLAVNCPRLDTCAAAVNVRMVGRSWYGVSKLMIDEINKTRTKSGDPSLTLDSDLQEWATQMAAEVSFYPEMATSKIRPDGTNVNTTLFTEPVRKLVIATADTSGTTDKDFMEYFYDRITQGNPNIMGDIFTTTIGIGIYQDKASYGTFYLVALLGTGTPNKSEYKSTVETETRTIRTLPSNFKLCNGKDGAFIAGHDTHKITLKVNGTDKTAIFQHASNGKHFMLDNTQASYKVVDPSIVSVVPKADKIELTGLKAGTTTFTATLNGQTVTYQVTVKGKKEVQRQRKSLLLKN